MTLPASGPISLNAIADEFGLARSTAFPTGFYGKGGAPASGPLSFADFYGRSNVHSASASPNPTVGSGNSTTIITETCECSVSGGSGSFGFSWVKVSGDPITAVSPTSSTTIFQSTGMGPGITRTAVFRCDVTDLGNGNLVVSSNTVSVICERI